MLRIFVLLISLLAMQAFAQSATTKWECSVGARLQKTWELYFENGVEGNCQIPVWGSRLSVGVAAVSTRLGTAFLSNALQQEQYWLQGQYTFRKGKRVEPYAGFGAGWFWLDVEDPMFNDIPHSAPLFALLGGAKVSINNWLLVRSGLGYQALVGNGEEGPGSVYPLFMQLNFETRLKW